MNASRNAQEGRYLGKFQGKQYRSDHNPFKMPIKPWRQWQANMRKRPDPAVQLAVNSTPRLARIWKARVKAEQERLRLWNLTRKEN